MPLFIDNLIKEIKIKNSRICVGLDPHPEMLPEFLINQPKETEQKLSVEAAVIFKFNKAIIDQIADVVVAVKPQIAFYELIGSDGLIALQKTIKYAQKKGLIVILDAKRGDIGTSAQAYARAYFKPETYNVDAITVNPYFGYDGIKPFLADNSRGVFALLRTSNSGAREFQDLSLADGRKVFQGLGELITNWGSHYLGKNGYSNLGAVVGATYPEELKLLRKEMPDCFFLIPGYGTQGGDVKDIISGFDKDGNGALINSARGIIFAYRRLKYSEKDFAVAARMAAIMMRDEINKALGVS